MLKSLYAVYNLNDDLMYVCDTLGEISHKLGVEKDTVTTRLSKGLHKIAGNYVYRIDCATITKDIFEEEDKEFCEQFADYGNVLGLLKKYNITSYEYYRAKKMGKLVDFLKKKGVTIDNWGENI